MATLANKSGKYGLLVDADHVVPVLGVFDEHSFTLLHHLLVSIILLVQALYPG